MAWLMGVFMPALMLAGPEAPPLPKTVLKDVPRIGYDLRICPFPGTVESILRYLGEPADYDLLMCVSGGAFRRFFEPDDGGNVDLGYLAPEPARRAFWALGYDHRVVSRDRGDMIRAIQESIALGRPAIGFGLVGPPEAGIVSGYDRNGDVLYGWSYFQEKATPGYFRVERWHETMSPGPPFGLITLGDRHDPPPARQVLTETLEWAIDLARRPVRACSPNHASGLAAYDAWANGLEVDTDFPPGDAKVMDTRVMIQGDQAAMTFDRHSAGPWLRRMADETPEAAEELLAAAAGYDAVAKLAERVWPWPMGGDAAKRGMADPATRRQLAAAVREARAREAEAVDHLAAALKQLGGGEPAPLSRCELIASKLVAYPAECRPNIESLTVPSALRAFAEYAGADFGYSTSDGQPPWRTAHVFPLLVGVWGDAFEFSWPTLTKDGAPADDEQPDLGDVGPRWQAVMDLLGFEFELLLKPDAARARHRLVNAVLDRGLPVVALDLPKPGHVFIGTGYAKGGETLIGWEMEPGDDDGIRFEPELRTELPGWTKRASGLVVAVGRRERVALPAVCRRALEQGVRLLRTREAGLFWNNAAAYEAWAKLLSDPALSAKDAATEKRRNELIFPAIWDLATRRHFGNVFLREAAKALPAAAPELTAAADAFKAIHDRMWEINRLAGATWPGEPLPKLIDPAVREQIGERLLQTRDQDLEVAKLIEAALAKLPASQPGA